MPGRLPGLSWTSPCRARDPNPRELFRIHNILQINAERVRASMVELLVAKSLPSKFGRAMNIHWHHLVLPRSSIAVHLRNATKLRVQWSRICMYGFAQCLLLDLGARPYCSLCRWISNGLNNGSLSYNLPWNTSAPKVPIIGR